MWVIDDGLRQRSPKLAWLGRSLGVLFCITLLISTITGGNMFQAWNVGVVTEESFGVPQPIVGVILAGAVQDYLVLFVSMRRKGRSLGQMARDELGAVGGAGRVGENGLRRHSHSAVRADSDSAVDDDEAGVRNRAACGTVHHRRALLVLPQMAEKSEAARKRDR